jgi:glucokinase
MTKVEKDYWVGFDLGGTKMMAKVFDRQFNTRARKRKKTKAREGCEAGISRIRETISEALEEAGVEPGQLLGIGIGSPGPLDLDRGVIVDLPNLAWKDVPLKKRLEQAFGCPTVVSNDVDAGTYGEYRFGAARDAHCVVGVFPGTGIGGGCVYEGRIFRGRKSSCLEIGHCQVIPNGPRCGCGLTGCLESVASRLAVASAAAAAAHRGDAPHLLEQTGMVLARIKSGALAAAIEAGDGTVERIVRDAAAWIGVAVAGVIHLLAPDVVVLGGGMVEAMPEIYVKEVTRAAKAHTMDSFHGSFKVVAAKLGDEATAMGAAAWAEAILQP